MSRLTTKATKRHVRPAKTQISLGIHPVWSESSLSAWGKLGSLATHWAHSEDSGQTGRMPRLIWVFAGRTCYFVGFVMRRHKCFCRVHCIRLGTYLLQFRNRQFQAYHPCLHHNHHSRPSVRNHQGRPSVRVPTFRIPCLLHNHTRLHNRPSIPRPWLPHNHTRLHNRPSIPCPGLPHKDTRLRGNAFLYTFWSSLQNTYI